RRGARGERAARGQRGENGDCSRQLSECGQRRDRGQRRSDERDRKCTVADGNERLEAEDGPQRRRVVLVVRGGITRQRNARREQQQRRRAKADRDTKRQTALHVDAERDREQRHDREEVALLEALRVGVGDLRRLEQQGGGEQEGRHG